MSKLTIDGTNVLGRHLEAVALDSTKIILHEGGSRSSKTWSIFQWLLIRALEGRQETYTIARNKLTWVKSTLLKDFEKLTQMYNIPVTPRVNANRPEQIYTVNGSEFAFFGLDYPEKLHGRTQDIFWLNEAMEIAKAHFDQLEMRTNKYGIIDYNPYDDSHWVFDLVRRQDVVLIKSTILDNIENLPQMIIRKIQGYEPTPENIEAGTADSYMWSVYGLGQKARLKGVIFNNWDIVDEIPEEAKFLGLGLDFGFTNDPSACLELWEYNKEIYLSELIYETGLLNVTNESGQPSIDQRLTELGFNNTTTIIADSAEPKSIRELQGQGWNIKPAVKGADSVRAGIQQLKQTKIHITRESINLESELRKYKWKEDKNEKSLNEPIDDFNHLIDALRYSYTHFYKPSIDVKMYSNSDILI